MRRLLFAVDGQHLTKHGDFSGIAAGSKGYLKCLFAATGSDWAGSKKVALFDETYAVPVSEAGECDVPDEVTDGKSFKLKLIGQKGTMRMSTNAVLVEQVL